MEMKYNRSSGQKFEQDADIAADKPNFILIGADMGANKVGN